MRACSLFSLDKSSYIPALAFISHSSGDVRVVSKKMCPINGIYPNILHHRTHQMVYVWPEKNRINMGKPDFLKFWDPDFCLWSGFQGSLSLESFCKFNFEWKNGLTHQNRSTGSDFRHSRYFIISNKYGDFWICLTLGPVDRF